jgi:hypothetical protein
MAGGGDHGIVQKERPVTAASAFSEVSISFIRDRENLTLLRSGRMFAAADIAILIANGKDLGEDGPLVLPPRVSLDLGELTRAERRDLLGALSPSLEVWGLLEDHQEWPDDFEGRSYEAPVTETGVSVDGRTWGWFPYWAGPTGELFPVGEEDGLEITLRFSGASMTSDTRCVGIRSVGDLAALSYQWSEESQDYQINYLVDDWRPLISDAFGYAGPPLCPACKAAKDWEITFASTLQVSTQILGESMKWLWQPCAEHEELGEQLVVTANSGYEWHWDGQVWVAGRR